MEESELHKAMGRLDKLQDEKSAALDKYIAACNLESRLRQAARARPDIYLPDWIEDVVDAYHDELRLAVDATQEEYKAASAAWRKLAGLD